MQGLVTPVVRGVERMSYLDIERTINELSIKVHRACYSHLRILRSFVPPSIDSNVCLYSLHAPATGLFHQARDGKLAIEDMAGGTFTISNGGVFGSLMGTPIINMPQSAILGMHATKDRPVVVNGQVRHPVAYDPRPPSWDGAH